AVGEDIVDLPPLVAEGLIEQGHVHRDAGQPRRGTGRSLVIDELVADRVAEGGQVVGGEDLFEDAARCRLGVDAGHGGPPGRVVGHSYFGGTIILLNV